MKALVTALVIGCVLAAESRADFELPFRGNRREGIVNAKNVSGFQIDLVGLQIEPANPITAARQDLYLLLPSAGMKEAIQIETMAISVDEFDSNYRMQPEVVSGAPISPPCDTDAPMRAESWFCWPLRDVIAEKRVPLTKLVGRATDAQGRLHPVLIAPDEIEARSPRTYHFAIRSAGELEAKWRILELDGTQIGQPVDVPEMPPGIVDVSWNPANVPAGWYRFRVDGKVYMEDAVRDARIDKVFWHSSPP